MAGFLQKGSKGTDVLAWQVFLKKISFFKGIPEGSYGDFTASATRSFQASKQLPQTGIVDKATLAAASKLGFILPTSVVAPPLRPSTIPASLTKKDIEEVAGLLKVSSASVRAVCVVESSGGGFIADGRPKIRFEGHIMWKELVRRKIDPVPISKAYPTLCYQEYTRAHYRNLDGEWERLEEARIINKDAANASASWGAFQIMGFNFQQSGYSSVSDYVADMARSERHQLIAFSKFITAQGLVPFLKLLNWLEFAKKYNGPRYIENKYDEKLAAAYTQALKEGYV